MYPVRVLTLLILCFMLAGHVVPLAAEGQPDIVGLSLGITLSEAEQKIKAADPAFEIKALKDKSGTVCGYEACRTDKKSMTMTGPRLEEQIIVLAGKNGLVNTVARSQLQPADNGLLPETLDAALREKYGEPSLQRVQKWDRIMAWAHDSNGNPIKDISPYLARPSDKPQQPSSWGSVALSRLTEAHMLAPKKLPQDGGTLILARFGLKSPGGSPDATMRVTAFSVSMFDMAALYADTVADKEDQTRRQREQYEKDKANKPTL